jgi:hypothetical protein
MNLTYIPFIEFEEINNNIPKKKYMGKTPKYWNIKKPPDCNQEAFK